MALAYSLSNSAPVSFSSRPSVHLSFQKLGWKDKWTEGRLEKLTGAEFDKEYAKAMLKEHQQDISTFEKAAEKVQEADIKQYAQDMLPKLRSHFKHAEQ